MSLMTRRAVVALAGAVALTAALAACGGGDSSGGGSSGAGKTLNVLIGANTQYPEEFAAWQKSISDKFKAQTGADREVRDVRQRERRADEDPDLGGVGHRPGRVRGRHHA